MQGIKSDRCGIGNIEAFDFTRHVETGHDIASLPRQLSEALAFGAENEGQGTGKRGIVNVGLRLAVEAKKEEPVTSQFLHGAGKIRDL